jgi:hypothetical protein
MDDNFRVERGWITVRATRLDDGRFELGRGELRLSPFDAWPLRNEVPIPTSLIFKASVQRLAFWRR